MVTSDAVSGIRKKLGSGKGNDGRDVSENLQWIQLQRDTFETPTVGGGLAPRLAFVASCGSAGGFVLSH